MKNIVFILLILSFSTHAYNRKNLSTNLLNVFSGQCKSVGTFTQNALNQTNSLIKVLEDLIEDEDCGDAYGLIDGLYAFQQQIEANTMSGEEYQKMSIERNIQELTLALNSTTDPALQGAISSQLTSARLQLISAESTLSSVNQLNQSVRENQGYYYAHQSLNNLLQTIPRMQNCSKKFRQYATQIVGNALSAASFFVNPALGAIMSGASVVVGTGLDAIYKAAQNVQLRKLDDIKLPTALSCSAEALTNMYCETLRAEEVVSKYANMNDRDDINWKGIPLIFRELPPLLDWLELVRAGSPAADSYDAQRRIEVMEHDAFLNELKQRMDGFISDTDREIETLTIDLDNYIMSKINFFVTQLQQSKPIATLNGKEFLAFRLLGFKGIPKCNFQGQIQACPNIQTFRVFYSGGSGVGYKFTIKDWNKTKEVYKEVFREARDFVNQQISRIINDDQENVLTQAFEGYIGKQSSYKIIENLKDYLAGIKNYLVKKNTDNRYGPHILSIENTQVILTDVYDLLKKWKDESKGEDLTPLKLNENAGIVLSKIYTILNLRNGERFIMNRIKSAVRWDIISKMENGDFDSQLVDIVRLSNASIITDITAYNIFDLQDITNDIKNSKGILKSTIKAFFKKMRKYYVSALKLIEEKELEPELKAKICVHLLASADNFKGRKGKRIIKACSGAEFKTVFERDRSSIKFNDFIGKKGDLKHGFDVRNCLYNKYMRKARIREQFQEN